MKRIATSQEMLFEQKLAQDGPELAPGVEVGPGLREMPAAPKPPGRDELAKIWKQVENAIYQGPDSALPEVIEILESIIPVIERAASEDREPSLEEQNAAEMDAERSAEQRYLDQGL